MTTPFSTVSLGTLFYCNGNQYIKTSTKTARLIGNGKVFYFKQEERVGQ